MRIFYVADTSPSGSVNSNLWRSNLYQSLVELGHEVIEFDYDLKKTFQYVTPNSLFAQTFIKKNRPRLSKALIKQIKKAHTEKPIDLFFSYFYDVCILPEIIDEIKSLGITTINWYCNGAHQLDLVKEISSHYDYCLTPEKFRLNDYKQMGANPIYCQEAANPNVYKPYNLSYDYDVTFVGQGYGERPDYIDYLLKNNIETHVWGPSWNLYAQTPIELKKAFLKKLQKKLNLLFSADGFTALHYKFKTLLAPENKNVFKTNTVHSTVRLPNTIIGQPLSDTDMIKMYSRSKINLGFSTCGHTHNEKERITQIRLRDFEVPISGGFYMVEYMQDLEEFFKIDKEIVCYHDKKDLVDKIKYYLTHDEEREAIRQAGYQRCLKDHTWHKRFQTVFKQIGLE